LLFLGRDLVITYSFSTGNYSHDGNQRVDYAEAEENHSEMPHLSSARTSVFA